MKTFKLLVFICILIWSQNSFALHDMSYDYALLFTTGTDEISVDDVIEGDISGATATVTDVTITGGSWVGNDAEGYVSFDSQTGVFQAENLDIVDGATDACAIAGDTSYCWVYSNGFASRFPRTIATVPNFVPIFEEDRSDQLGYFYSGMVTTGGTSYFTFYASTDFDLSVSGNDSRVKVVMEGIPRTSGTTDLPNCTSFETIFYIYQDRVATQVSLVLDDDVVLANSPTTHRLLGFNTGDTYVTSPASVYENSGSESAAVRETAYDSADYLGGTSTELDFMWVNIEHTDDASFSQYCDEDDAFSYAQWNGVTLGSGTHTITNVFIFDTSTRDGSAKLYGSAGRLIMGLQFTDDAL